MTITVIIPVYNSSALLADTLEALRKSSRVPEELIVVDDGSVDDSGSIAVRHGATLITMPHNFGPAFCRNSAALTAKSDVLVFLDADTRVHTDTLARMESHFDNEPELGAVFGSYDDQPSDEGLCSQFKNLAHCYVHHSSKRRALTFWSGCGAIRRDLFLSVDGFDQRYRRPSVEDIDLGYRLSDRGANILLDPEICVTHLKRWTLWNSIVTDVLDRGMPWMVLLLERRKAPNDLNIRRRHRIALVLSSAGLLCLLGCGRSLHWLLWASGLMLMGAGMDAALLRFIYKKRGLRLFFVGASMTLVQNLCKLTSVFGGVGLYAYRKLQSTRQRRRVREAQAGRSH
jgi:glycosyltransferase involved in cell wall biosynthesis